MILWTIASVLVTSTFGYWMHRILHKEWMGRLHRSHMAHHEQHYPSHDFSSDVYREAGKDNTTWTFVVLGSPIILTPIVLWCLHVVDGATMLSMLSGVGLVGFLNIYVHDWLHLNVHATHRISHVRRLIAIHRVHHEDMGKNFGIYSFVWDRICGTFSKNERK